MERKIIKGNRLNRKKEEVKDITQIFLCSLLLLVGMAIGIAMSLNGTFALDTSTPPNATTSNATNSNATSSNATSSNATSSNATSSNATSSNATSNNVYIDSNRIYLEKIEIKTKEAKVGDKVAVNLCTNININSAKLIFKSNNGNQFTIYLSNLNNDEYMEIPSTVPSDTYYLSQLTLDNDNSTTTYTNGNDYNFNIEIIITEKETKSKIYNNEDVNANTIKESKKEETKDITINATGNSVISKEVFNSIKGTDKKVIIKYQDNEIIFSGRDIKEAKDIDVSMKIICITDDDTSKVINNNGYIINFANNGDLPGKEIVRIKATTEMKNYFENKKLYVYYYDEPNNKFTLIARNITLENDYYEFAINHNSKYILTDTQIDTKTVTVDENIVDFQNSNKTNTIIILVSILIVVAVTIFILLMKKKENKKKD